MKYRWEDSQGAVAGGQAREEAACPEVAREEGVNGSDVRAVGWVSFGDQLLWVRERKEFGLLRVQT